VQSPEKVAAALVRLAERPRRTLFVPRIAALGVAVHALLPRTCERLLLRALEEFHLRQAEAPTAGALYEPAAEVATVHGRRKPRIGAPLFAVWAARELLRMGADAARERVEAWRTPSTT
jgi:hypothetical protein